VTVTLPTFKLPKLEWLFKQSDYGGVKHIAVNVDEWAAYQNSGDFRTALKIETMCGKKLKYNPIWSVMTPKEGLVKNICPDCVINYESEEKGEEAEVFVAEYRERNRDLPF
jgi:hypothetical protein